MRLADIVDLARQIAAEAHAGQIEESTGDPYIHHVERVANLVEGDDAKAVAWLHDVMEDTPITAQDLRRLGIPENVTSAVTVLSRAPWHSYAEYIQLIQDSGDELALTVKLADLRDHLRPNCPERLRERYEKALRVLSISDQSHI